MSIWVAGDTHGDFHRFTTNNFPFIFFLCPLDGERFTVPVMFFTFNRGPPIGWDKKILDKIRDLRL